MGLSALHVGELIGELRPLLQGASVRAVQPLPPRDLLLVFSDAAGALRRLRISVDPEAARVHLQVAPVRRHAGSADPFFARLEAALVESSLRAIEQLQGDRIVRLEFRRDERPSATLIAELTGRHANLVLLDAGGRVQETLVSPAAKTPAAERLATGAPYARPPGRPVEGPGPALAEVFPAPLEPGRLSELAPLSARVDAALGAATEERFREAERRELERRLERREQGAAALVAGLEERARSCAAAERLRQDAELLLAHLTTLGRAASVAGEVTLPDAFEPGAPPRRIALDPGLSPRRNAEKLFARYKKLVRTAQRLPEERALAADNLQRVRTLLARLRAGAEDARVIEAEARSAGLLPPAQEARRKTPEPEARLPYLRFRALRGSEIRVGRTAAENDRLTFRESRGNDVWLHTADTPGSHVVLRITRDAEPDGEEVLDAAHLAVHFSPLRGAPRADVHVARRKEVHKPRKAAPGLVTLSGGKTLRVRIEPARLERLLVTRGRIGAAPDAGEP